MGRSALTGLDPAWVPSPAPPLLLANGEDEAEVQTALGLAGAAPRPLGAYRGFHWHRLDGALLCVAGVGPSNVELALTDAAAAGIRVVVRIGTCGALRNSHRVGDVVVARAGIAFHDGVASVRADQDEVRTDGDPALADALEQARRERGVPGASGVVMGTPFFHAPGNGARAARYHQLCQAEADVLDMETGTLFYLAATGGVKAGCVVGVANAVGDHALDGPRGLAGPAAVVAGWLRAGAPTRASTR